jgi:hypothetical protein
MTNALRFKVLGAAVLVLTVGSTDAASTGPRKAGAAVGAAPPACATAHVRGVTPRAVLLLAQGAARSATFRELVEALEASDVIVWVETDPLGRPSQLRFVGAAPSVRFLRITIDNLLVPDDLLLPWLGHELQHAVELARAPEAASPAGVREYYRRHGLKALDGSFCTEAVQRVSVVVENELALPRPGQ